MLISHECPIAALPTSVSFNDYDYCLVHLLETHSAYLGFYDKSRRNNRELLLDNSIFELGTAFNSDKFADWVKKLTPSYYVIPDVLENSEATITSYQNFLKSYPDLPGLRIGVVQGKTYQELVDCYQHMAKYSDYIALSFDLSYYQTTGFGVNKLQRQCSGRQKLIESFIRDEIYRADKPHHLLGASLMSEFNWYVRNNIPGIRSCDTSNPIVAAIEGIRYSSDLGLNQKPKTKLIEYIDLSLEDYKKCEKLVEYNTDWFRKAVNGI